MVYHQTAWDPARRARVEQPGGLRKRTARCAHDPQMRLVVYYFDADLSLGASKAGSRATTTVPPPPPPRVPALTLQGSELTAFWVLAAFPAMAAATAAPDPSLTLPAAMTALAAAPLVRSRGSRSSATHREPAAPED